MIALVERNLRLYFQNKSTVFWSLFSPLLVLGLYELFIQYNLVASFQHQTTMLNQWLLGGALSVAALTTSFTVLGIKVFDEAKGQRAAFFINGVSERKLNSSYLIASGIVGFIMTVVILAVYVTFFYLQGQMTFHFSNLMKVLPIILLSTVISVGINGIVLLFVHNEGSFSGVSTTLNVLSGFLVGAYMPFGAVPAVAQHIMKYWPGFLSASLFRNALVTTKVDLTTKEFLGMSVKWGNQVLSTTNISLILLLASVILIAITQLRNRE
ncbi:hypothetical protein ESZ50_07545 [Weissella muntiaci]|uniref:ABC transporter permease n=1 Tax=Weissella muntiaci TaxID=2508881 RepID=A0A6C2C514_9LACO|nr:ABC transporter permease [Weissella muntiaci]TYC49091.1 hypothetical protein ESZ50_07545 [Weissella muntiaci]